MNRTTNRAGICVSGVSLSLLVLLCVSFWAQAKDDKFDLLKTKTAVYIFHSTGICNLKVADLPPETLRQLGYASTSDSVSWNLAPTNREMAVKQFRSAKKKLNTQLSAGMQRLHTGGDTLMVLFVAVSLVMYLFICYCFSLICTKAGEEPGILVWVPILQILPLLRAAGMSPLWFLAWFVPGLNLVAQIIWCFSITKAREKAAWVAVLLILPVTNLFALLYLAFSDAASSEDEPVGRVPLVLETN
jgi:hypothetical protein